MQRELYAAVVLFLASMTLGCAMCASPDDYCGPVPGTGMGFNDRAGSILQGQVPSNAVFDSEVSQDAIGGTISEGIPPGAEMQGQPTPAPVPEMQGAAPRQMR